MDDVDHYVKKLKEHEAQRLSTNERNAYWKNYQLLKKDPFLSFGGVVAVQATNRKK